MTGAHSAAGDHIDCIRWSYLIQSRQDTSLWYSIWIMPGAHVQSKWMNSVHQMSNFWNILWKWCVQGLSPLYFHCVLQYLNRFEVPAALYTDVLHHWLTAEEGGSVNTDLWLLFSISFSYQMGVNSVRVWVMRKVFVARDNQLCPDDPERQKQQEQLVCGKVAMSSLERRTSFDSDWQRNHNKWRQLSVLKSELLWDQLQCRQIQSECLHDIRENRFTVLVRLTLPTFKIHVNMLIQLKSY